jgi:hypothetical protein
VIARKVDLDLATLGLGLLQAQDVGLMSGHELLDGAFLQDRADTVDIPGVKLHSLVS